MLNKVKYYFVDPIFTTPCVIFDFIQPNKAPT